MQSEFSVTSALAQNVEQWFDLGLSSDQMRVKFETWLAATCYTRPSKWSGGNKPRYRKGYIQSLNSFYIALKESQLKHFCVFGYWYEDQFYTTYKGAHKLTTQFNLKTTKVLHDLGLDQKTWDSLPRGMYYASTLKPHYT